MTNTRSATTWHKTIDRHGRTILYITSDECTVSDIALCSVYDPMSDLPSRRMVRCGDGWTKRDFDEEDQPYPSHGLIVYGRSKFDRPSIVEAYNFDRIAAAAIEAATNDQP